MTLHPKLERALGYVCANADHGSLTAEQRERAEKMAIEAQREIEADALLAESERMSLESTLIATKHVRDGMNRASKRLRHAADRIRKGETP